MRTWRGAQGLAEDVRYYGSWMRDEAVARIGHLYPAVPLPGGGEATVIAWIWARTVICPNPACGARMPLVRSFWIGKKKGKEAWVQPIVEDKSVKFSIGHGPRGPALKERLAAMALRASFVVHRSHLLMFGQKARRPSGHQLMAIVAEGQRERMYLPPVAAHEGWPKSPCLRVPDTELPEQALDSGSKAMG